MPDSFLHERRDFKALVETVAESEKINDPGLVEKDYWIMYAVFGLKQLGLTFELKGGTSLSKGFGIIQRFSEDIDIRIEPLAPSLPRSPCSRGFDQGREPRFTSSGVPYRVHRSHMAVSKPRLPLGGV